MNREVLCLEFLYLRIITGCADGKIRIWSVLNGFCLRVMRGNSVSDPVTSLAAASNRFIFCSDDFHILGTVYRFVFYSTEFL